MRARAPHYAHMPHFERDFGERQDAMKADVPRRQPQRRYHGRNATARHGSPPPLGEEAAILRPLAHRAKARSASCRRSTTPATKRPMMRFTTHDMPLFTLNARREALVESKFLTVARSRFVPAMGHADAAMTLRRAEMLRLPPFIPQCP